MANPDSYEIHAIRYATNQTRKRFHSCLHCTPDDVHETMPMDFYVWVIQNKHRTIVVDCGSKQWKCEQRGHDFIRCPVEGLEAIGINADKTDDLILTHLHWDHAGNVDLFKNAMVHLTDTEMRNATSQDMADPVINTYFLVDDVCTVVQRLFDGAVTFHHQDREIAPGVSLHKVGGHSAGMQVVRVYTKRGWVVLASDATHYYTNYMDRNPFPILYNFNDMITGWDRCLELADSPDHVVPGHDPLVLKRYLPASHSLDGDVVRLDLDPMA